VFVEGVWIRSA